MPPKRTRPGNAKTTATKRRKTATDNKEDRHLDIEEGESYSINTITAANQAGPQPLRSFCDSLGLHLPASIKAKIHKREFVELGALLTPPGSAPLSISFSLVREGQTLTLGQQTPKLPTIDNIEQWTSAFLIYMSVYLEVHTSHAIELLKYTDIVRSAAQQFGGLGWRTYDIQFRLKQAMAPAQSWTVIDSELWLRVLLAPTPSNFRTPQSNRAQQQQLRATNTPFHFRRSPQGNLIGICWEYNRTGTWKRQNCQFQHRCAQCRQSGHPSIKCALNSVSYSKNKFAGTQKNQLQLKHLLQEVAPTPIKVEVLAHQLRHYPVKKDRDILLNGFKFGFRLGYSGARVARESPCLRSALEKPEIVRNKLAKEAKLGRIVGPFHNRPMSNLQCSPLGLVPKKQPGEFRLIHHLSFPSRASINDFIDEKLCRVKYTSFDEAVGMIADLCKEGRPVFMAKLDIKSAFRLLPVNPLDFDLLGFKFDGYWIDRSLPFACPISCRLFEMFSCFLEFYIKKVTGVQSIKHYLDDFILAFISRDQCRTVMTQFQDACSNLGVPIAHEKRRVQLK